MRKKFVSKNLSTQNVDFSTLLSLIFRIDQILKEFKMCLCSHVEIPRPSWEEIRITDDDYKRQSQRKKEMTTRKWWQKEHKTSKKVMGREVRRWELSVKTFKWTQGKWRQYPDISWKKKIFKQKKKVCSRIRRIVTKMSPGKRMVSPENFPGPCQMPVPWHFQRVIPEITPLGNKKKKQNKTKQNKNKKTLPRLIS